MAKPQLVIRLILGLVLLAGLGFLYIPGYSKIQELKEHDKKLAVKVEKLAQENAKLSEELEKLKNDPVYLESIARKEMGLVREGEVIYRLIPDETE